jgi:PE family
MSFVIAAPEIMTSAATDLVTIGSNLSAAHTAAAPATLAVLPAAADEVSTGIAQLFSQHAADYQAMAGQAAAFQDQFVQILKTCAGWYASCEADIAWFLLHLAGLPPGHIGQIIGIPPGQLKKIPFINGQPNPFFGIPPGHWRDLAPVPTPVPTPS